jgi:hypothetical protein
MGTWIEVKEPITWHDLSGDYGQPFLDIGGELVHVLTIDGKRVEVEPWPPTGKE